MEIERDEQIKELKGVFITLLVIYFLLSIDGIYNLYFFVIKLQKKLTLFMFYVFAILTLLSRIVQCINSLALMSNEVVFFFANFPVFTYLNAGYCQLFFGTKLLSIIIEEINKQPPKLFIFQHLNILTVSIISVLTILFIGLYLQGINSTEFHIDFKNQRFYPLVVSIIYLITFILLLICTIVIGIKIRYIAEVNQKSIRILLFGMSLFSVSYLYLILLQLVRSFASDKMDDLRTNNIAAYGIIIFLRYLIGEILPLLAIFIYHFYASKYKRDRAESQQGKLGSLVRSAIDGNNNYSHVTPTEDVFLSGGSEQEGTTIKLPQFQDTQEGERDKTKNDSESLNEQIKKMENQRNRGQTMH